MELSGRIRAIDETKSFGANGFRKREIVITTDEQYPQHIVVEFTQDKCDLLNNYKPGEAVTVGINLRGREWVNPQGETKYFNTIQGWKIFKQEGQQQTNYSPAANGQNSDFAPAENYEEEEHDDLPF